MKLTMVANPPTHLALLRQLGVEHAVHYDMHGLPDDRAGHRVEFRYLQGNSNGAGPRKRATTLRMMRETLPA